MQPKAEENRAFIQNRKTVACPGLYKISVFPKSLNIVAINPILLFQGQKHFHAKILSTISMRHPEIAVTISVIPLPLEKIIFFSRS